MGDHTRTQEEIDALRMALDAETQRSLDAERRLERANADFEEFVSIAAHNLRESLRDVAAFSDLIAEDSAGRLDAEAVAYLERIRRGAAEMNSLLADVVDYWTTAAGDPAFSSTDMEAVLSQALLSIDKDIAARSAIVTHDPLPAVTGDFQTLAKVLRHLIRNALEYCDTLPRVHIACTVVNGECVFSVRDNGPGIDPAFQGRLFRVFKRLHGKEHPGSGLGLACCRKAVESLGGRVWLESAPGTGSTFYFALQPAE